MRIPGISKVGQGDEAASRVRGHIHALVYLGREEGEVGFTVESIVRHCERCQSSLQGLSLTGRESAE